MSPTTGKAALFAALARVCGLLLLALAGCGSPIVGAECKGDLAICDGMCVDLSSDFRNCGRCGNDCGPFVCAAGICQKRVREDVIMDGAVVMLPDGNVVPVDDGGRLIEPDAGPGPDDSEVPFPPYDSSLDADTGLVGCSVGQSQCGDMCIDVGSDLNHCGQCDNACSSGEVCSGGACAPECGDGLTRCGATCFDLQTSPRHCGRCGNVCASGICLAGTCADEVPGHLVVIGHDYEASNSFQGTLLGNSLFLARGAPVRTLVFEGTAAPASVAGAERAIDAVAASIGREWEKTEGLESLITFQLAQADALLIHAQEGSTDSVLAKQGELWGMAMVEFLRNGGVVVVLDGGTSNHSGVQVLLEPSGLFFAAGRERIETQDLEILNPGTGIALRVGDMYRAASHTVRFLDISSPGNPVSMDEDGFVVIFQRIVRR